MKGDRACMVAVTAWSWRGCLTFVALFGALVRAPHFAHTATMSDPSAKVSNHPVLLHKLTLLRKKETSSKEFRQLMHELTFYLGYMLRRCTFPAAATVQGVTVGSVGVSSQL